ncbi:MAG: hypothetical protein J1F60_11275 [Oscillospiraceae bacterium]|nr:hypothetical protein [Oscillospiraceae bacterium]
MFKTGLQKELMFFSRSFRMWGVLIAAFGFALLDPLLMKALDSLSSNLGEIDPSFSGLELETAGMNMSQMGVVGAMGDLTSTLLLILTLVIMYAAGGELKKRSMIIPQNAGLTPQFYLLPKFVLYPVFGAVLTFVGILISWVFSFALYEQVNVDIGQVLLASLLAAVFQLFLISLYLTLGLCTAKAGLSVAVIYGGNVILSSLFTSLGADKFHPFTLTAQAQGIIMGGDVDNANLWGSIGVTLLLVVLCYFVTLFVVSAKRVDNRGVEEINL